MPDPHMKLVLVTPEIPWNTGAIGRTCVALNLELILIKPYGFSLDENMFISANTTAGRIFWMCDSHRGITCIFLKKMANRVFTNRTINPMRIWFSDVNPKVCQ
jgi:tRNA(Leu) C34 or U34 (ribose-2'-O)-methylase TrmL